MTTTAAAAPRINPFLFKLAQAQAWRESSPRTKNAFQPPEPAPGPQGAPPPGGDPAAAGGAAPGGVPPVGQPPQMSPAPMPGMMPGMPAPMDPSMGAAGMGGMPQQPGMPPGPGGAPGGQKMKPEQYMQMLDYRLHNMQQQITALLNSQNVTIPAGALITPPGTVFPQAEAALPGGPSDPSQAAQPQQQESSILPIEPMQGASPAAAQAGQQAKAAQALPPECRQFLKEAEANAPAGWRVLLVKAGAAAAPVEPVAPTVQLSSSDFVDQLFSDDIFSVGTPIAKQAGHTTSAAAATAAMLRSRVLHGSEAAA